MARHTKRDNSDEGRPPRRHKTDDRNASAKPAARRATGEPIPGDARGNMKLRVHFSMDFQNDFEKFTVIRDTMHGDRVEPLPFMQADAWDRLTRVGDDFVTRWIDKQVTAADAVVVLIGARTYTRALVRYEISKAFKLHRPMIGISLRGISNGHCTALSGKIESPFDYVTGAQSQDQRPQTYEWVGDDGPNAFPGWLTAGRR